MRSLLLLPWILVAAARAGEAAAPPPPAAIRLAATLQVDSTGVFLDQLLAFEPAQAIPHIRVSEAPAFGRVLQVPQAQAAAWVRQFLPEAVSTNWAGAASAQVSRRARPLEESELRDLLTATLQREVVKDRGELELRLARPWATVSVPDEELSLRLLDAGACGSATHGLVRFDLLAGGERTGNWQLSVQSKVWGQVPVARSALQRGQRLADADITLERRDLLVLREALSASALKDDQLDLTEPVRAGQPVLARGVKTRPLIHRGGVVQGVIRDGLLDISLKVEALEDGLAGQTVRVRNLKNRREYLAKVHDEQTVWLLL